jgi:hypothetical protein
MCVDQLTGACNPFAFPGVKVRVIARQLDAPFFTEKQPCAHRKPEQEMA